MPRQALTKSATSVYHAILRGVNKQHVFDFEPTYTIQNMRNVQNINIRCVSGVPVPVAR